MKDMVIREAADPALLAQENLLPDIYNRFINYINRKQTTTKGYITCFRQFLKWTAENGIQRPDRQDVLNYVQYLEGAHFGRTGQEQLKAGTKKQYLRAVKQFFSWAAVEGLYPVNIADNIHGAVVRGESHKKDALTQDEAKEIAAAIDRSTEAGKRLYAMYLLSVRRGLRTVELSKASVKDVHHKGSSTYIDIWGKGHDEADVTRMLDPDTASALADYMESRTDHPTPQSPLFTSTSNRSKGQRIAPTTISTMLKSAMVSAGYDSDRLTAHSLRHTAGTAAVNHGDLYAAQHFLRHVDPKTTEVYLHQDDQAIDDALVMQIYNSYHDTQDAAQLRKQAIDLISKVDPAQLSAVCDYLKKLTA